MRFFEFKTISSSNTLTEVAKMSAKLWKDKYIISTVHSIKNKKDFDYIDNKEEKFGLVDKITVDGEAMSPDEWQQYALANDNATVVNSTLFSINGQDLTINKLLKADAVKGSLTPNKGDIAEAVLGSAITAKFRNGGGNVTTNDIIEILKSVVSEGSTEGTTNYQTSGIEEDNYKFMLTLNNSSLKPLKLWMEEEDPMGNPANFALVKQFGVNRATIKDLQKQVSDAAEYANRNKRAVTAVDKAKIDPSQNIVEIMSDGGDGTQQNITKVDLKLSYDGQIQRLLSLKAGAVKQFGQVSGGEWEAVSNFFESIFKFRLPDSMKAQFGFKSSDQDDYKDYNYGEGPFANLYSEMAKQAMEYTAGDDTRKEYNLVKNVYDGINFHATRGEEGVTMVILSPSSKVAYKELAFDKRLLSALELYDLQVVNEPGNANHKISIIGNLKTEKAIQVLGKDNAIKIPSKSVLVQLRSAKMGNAIRNVVEMGELLKDLSNVEKLDKAEATKSLKQQPEPEARQQPTPDVNAVPGNDVPNA